MEQVKLSDFDTARSLAVQMHSHCNFDKHYTFIYDETNNIRKFYLNEKSFNYSFDTNFVLGGVVYEDAPSNVDDLFDSLNLQSNITEVKFKHIASGDFLSILKSNKLTKILEYIRSNNIYIHYYSVNFLYFSLVDVIDSAIEGSGRNDLIYLVHELKSILYDICKEDIENTIELLNRSNYPNVSKDYFEKFAYALKKIINRRKREPFYAEPVAIINEILDGAVRNKRLSFITDEKSKVLIDNFFGFYLHPLYMFKNSIHVLDNEESIKDIFTDMNFVNDVSTHVFEDSASNRLIQLSDIMVGFIGKLTQFVNVNDFSSIGGFVKGLNKYQKENLCIFFDILNKSVRENNGFINQTISITNHKFIAELERQISV
jgi:hypothetical protein